MASGAVNIEERANVADEVDRYCTRTAARAERGGQNPSHSHSALAHHAGLLDARSR
jgi:hypothetical protein